MRVVDQDMKAAAQDMTVAAPDTKNDTPVYSLEKTKAADSAEEHEVLSDVAVVAAMTAVEVAEAVVIVPVLVQLV